MVTERLFERAMGLSRAQSHGFRTLDLACVMALVMLVPLGLQYEDKLEK